MSRMSEQVELQQEYNEITEMYRIMEEEYFGMITHMKATLYDMGKTLGTGTYLSITKEVGDKLVAEEEEYYGVKENTKRAS